MDIKIKEPLYLMNNGQEYVVRQGTSGIERNRVVFFYDNTRTIAVGFSRDYCVENPSLFQVSRNITDKEISLKDALKVISEFPIEEQLYNELVDKLKTL